MPEQRLRPLVAKYEELLRQKQNFHRNLRARVNEGMGEGAYLPRTAGGPRFLSLGGRQSGLAAVLLRGNAQRGRRVATDPSTRMLEREDL